MLVPLLQLLAAASAAVARSPTVTLSSGATVTGLTETNVKGTAINTYLGIPYTENAPVGDKRWKQSQLKTLTSDLNATAYGSICYGDPSLDAVSGQFPPSEDCLYLNVFTPAGVTPTSNLPVMVWVHGGGFIAGAGNPYPGNNLIGASRQQVVVVNLNYRLGALGFFSNEDILNEGDGANFGLRDQEVAFEWVKQNIRSFGGNPNNITAFGESAGAVSVGMHLLSRGGNQQLFQRIILQSGGYSPIQNTPSRSTQTTQTDTIASAVGCRGAQSTVLSCLRKADAAAIFAAGKGLNWSPTIDNVYMLGVPYLGLVSGQVSRVPTVIGSNTDDGWFFSFDGAEASTFDTWIRSTFSLMTEQEQARLAALYPAATFPSAHHRASEVYSDFLFVCPGELISTVQSRTVPNTYRYRFNYPGMALGQPLVLHAEDLNYVFNRVANLKNDTDTKAVVDHFQTFWTKFAITGSPNGKGNQQTSPAKLFWPEFDLSTKEQMILQPTLAVEANSAYMPGHSKRCAFWYEVEARTAAVFDK